MRINPLTIDDVEGREVVYERHLKHSAERVFEVWSKAEHLKHWYGPNGFSITTTEFDFRPGGHWKFIMHGPNGVDYPNDILYNKIEPPFLMDYDHVDEAAPNNIFFRTRIEIEPTPEGCVLRMHSIFNSREQIAHLAKEVKAIEGGHQTMDRMVAYVHSAING